MAKFELNDKELAAANKWVDEHLAKFHKGKMPYAGVSSYGTQYNVVFDSVFGMIVHVECSRCAHSKNVDFKDYAGCITDVSDW